MIWAVGILAVAALGWCAYQSAQIRQLENDAANMRVMMVDTVRNFEQLAK